MIFENDRTLQKSWKILYNRYEGMEAATVRLLNTELSKYLIRADGVNTVYILPCEKEGSADYENAFVVGLYKDSALIRGYIEEKEIPRGGYCVKVAKKKEDPDRRLVLITAHEPEQLYYGAAEYLDDYANTHAVAHGSLRYPESIYETVTDEYLKLGREFCMSEYVSSFAPKLNERGVFCWGQTINDYRSYFKDLARLKINRAVIWNTFMPVNAKEVQTFAESLGIKILWGFAWGWTNKMLESVKTIDETYIRALEDEVIELYEREYLPLGVKDIYFQSFTELQCDSIGGRKIASVVTDFVNETAHRLWAKYPDLNLRFGLHATSVKNHLSDIARVDKRIEIIWEDCGWIPFSYWPGVESEEVFKQTQRDVERLINLRDGAKTGFMLKGFQISDWTRFERQTAPFVLGENSRAVIDADRRNRRGNQKIFFGEWLKYGKYALKMISFINGLSDHGCGLYLVGIFDDGIYLPEALCAEMMWNCDVDYDDLLMKVAQRDYITEP